MMNTQARRTTSGVPSRGPLTTLLARARARSRLPAIAAIGFLLAATAAPADLITSTWVGDSHSGMRPP